MQVRYDGSVEATHVTPDSHSADKAAVSAVEGARGSVEGERLGHDGAAPETSQFDRQVEEGVGVVCGGEKGRG